MSADRDPLKAQHHRPSEMDERFPSGEWKGFWLQGCYMGRQWMRDVMLHFCDGAIEGLGSDCVGDFVFRGRYDLRDGKVTLFKRYIGGHEVVYTGCNEGDGLWLWGTWQIPAFDRGGFHLWPKGMKDPTGSELSARKDVPVSEMESVLA